MDKTKHINQEEINKVWRKEWINVKDMDPEPFFRQRLFIEGYPVFKKHIPSDAKEILDAGGGTGRYGLKIARDFPQSQVVISDILDESLRVVASFAENLNIKNVTLQRDNILSSSFPDNKFDVVLCDVVIQHLPEYKKAIQELTRITKPGGKVVIAVNNWWNLPHTVYKFFKGKNYEYGYEKSYTKGELRELLKNNGMKVEAEDGFYVGYGLYRLKKYHIIFAFLGRVINRMSKIMDRFTNRFFSHHFGFEIVIVGQK